MKKDFLVKETPGCGKGVFSTKSFRKNQQLFSFGTKIVSWKKANHRSVQLGKNRWLNPSRYDLGYYVNHSCNPNARFEKPHFIAALRPIKPGQEITLDYATLVNIPKWDMPCFCGQNNCRKIIKSYSKLPKNIQKKYKDIISFILK
ncbi:MAG: SET domain-containing protein-lysine N-methyltransferase [Nanoarchaeota archaeon]|nr:SET domain-containing protein-lysine N-methyltransferase [Nanoarchaeota archaeon]